MRFRKMAPIRREKPPKKDIPKVTVKNNSKKKVVRKKKPVIVKDASDSLLMMLYVDIANAIGDDLAKEVLGNVTYGRMKSLGYLDTKPVVNNNNDEVTLFNHNNNDISIDEITTEKAIKQIYEKKQEPHPELDNINGNDIRKEDWLPYRKQDGMGMPDEDFRQWILSFCVAGFSHALHYHKFELYKKQADTWLEDKTSVYDFAMDEDIDDYIQSEIRKIRINTSYIIRKSGKLKEQLAPEGYLMFGDSFYDCQSVLCYLIDCGYSLLIAKCRQIGISSVMGYIAAVKTMFRLNFFSKFIAHTDNKTNEIFRDKIKYAVSEFPTHLQAVVYNYSGNMVTFTEDKSKGKQDSGMRVISCETATPAAINGGTPSMVFVDEAAFVNCLTEMVAEWEPTKFWNNPNTGKREIKGQIIMWGTGGKIISEVYEDMYRDSIEAWKTGNIDGAFIPVFLDFYCNPGHTAQHYETLRLQAYNKKGIKHKDLRIIFHAANALTLEDVFLKSTDTLVPFEYINAQLDRIGEFNKRFTKDMPIGGRFIPEYDYSQPNTAGSLFEYQFHTVRWETMEEVVIDDNNKRPVIITPYIYRFPEQPDTRSPWRYFQGTDPINSSSGHSYFSSCIWDNCLLMPVALLSFREDDFRECYRQAIMMGIFYGKPPHLIEYNIGEEFINKIEHLSDMGQTLIMNNDLNPRYRIQGAKVGISNKANTKPRIIEAMRSMLSDYGNRICFRQPFEQLRTFVQKPTSNGQSYTWAAQDLNRHRDDDLFSITYSQMAADTFANAGLVYMPPDEIKLIQSQVVHIVRLPNGQLSRTTLNDNKHDRESRTIITGGQSGITNFLGAGVRTA